MIWSLQILRFIAAMMVVYLHAAQGTYTFTGSAGTIPLQILITGHAGVDLFFVLSGVVIAKTAPTMTSAQFLWRRIRRVLPIYFVAGALAMLQAAKIGFGWRAVLATLLLWPATDVMTAPLLGVAWTLCFEILFYLSAALVLHDRRWLYVLGCLYVTAFSLRAYGPVFQFLGNPIIMEFLFGVAIACAPSSRFGLLCIPFGFATLSLAGFLQVPPGGGGLDFLIGHENIYRIFVWGIPSTLIVYGFMQIKARESVWTHLGDASYSIYLFHGIALGILLVLSTMIPINPDLLAIGGTMAALLLSWRIHVLIEVPILKSIPKNIETPTTR